MAEVSTLANSVKNNSSKLLPSYLVLHSAILMHHLPSVKKLTYAKKFVVIIPVNVIETLDSEKKCKKAREAIRWLETELKQGNRFLRAQRQCETKTLPRMEYPRRKDKQLWDGYQILECCNYLIKETHSTEKKPEDEEVPFVTLLISKFKENRNSEIFINTITAVAGAIGVGLEDVKDFCSKVFKHKNGR
ncbi:Protein SMG5 [Nymphon striatum]|nr:Protein SMG5 [Nymphon striatum]